MRGNSAYWFCFMFMFEAVIGKGFYRGIFNEISKVNTRDNVSISPASVYVSLGLAFLHAEGITANEVHRVLELPGSTKAEVEEHLESYLDKLHARKNARFDIFNGIFFDGKHKVEQWEEPKALTQKLSTIAANVNFTDIESTLNFINDWFAKATEGEMRNVLAKEDLNSNTTAVILNAALFRSKWKHGFNRTLTRDSDFFTNQTTAKPIDMMFLKKSFLYANWRELNVEILILPFEGMDVFMMIFLPKSIDGLDAFESEFSQINYAKLQPEFNYKNVELHLPKFVLNYDVSLNEALKNLGIRSLHSGVADFRSVLAGRDPVESVAVKHKTYLKIDELGVGWISEEETRNDNDAPSSDDETILFEVNHPFMFLITDASAILYVGHVRNL